MEQWKHLRQQNEHLPPLLIKATFDRAGYSVRLTDLSRIWIETLSKKDIIARARRSNCSIDPGEDSDQYNIFVEKVQGALQQHDKTRFAISAAIDGSLKLHLEAPLPSPLPTFEWNIDLERANDSSVELELVSPLLRRAHSLNHRLESLIAEIQAKDKIIAKITDRLETSGHDLTAVFPGVSNVKLSKTKSQQEQLARHIRGLGRFDAEAWEAQLAAGGDTSVLPPEATGAIFDSLHLPTTGPEAEDWWLQIPIGRVINLGEEQSEDAGLGDSGTPNRQQNVDGEDTPGASQHDDFQKQATPPRLRNQSLSPDGQGDVEMSGTSGNTLPDDESTEDEDDLDAPPPNRKPSSKGRSTTTVNAQTAPRNNAPPPPPAPEPTSTKQPLTTPGPFTHEDDTDTEDDDDDDNLDGPSQPSKTATSTSNLPSHQKSQTPQPVSSTAPSPRKKLGTLGGRLRTESPNEASTSPVEEPEEPEEPTPKVPSPKPKPKAKLGTIGGSKSKPPPPPSVSKDPTPPPPAKKKMGTIGGKHAAATSASSMRAATNSATPEPQPKEPAKTQPAEPEDPVKRAEAKRDALKRALEEKAKAPAKKKRKF